MEPMTRKEHLQLRIAMILMLIPLVILGPAQNHEAIFLTMLTIYILCIVFLELRELAAIVLREKRDKEKGEKPLPTTVSRQFNLINFKEECQWKDTGSGWTA